MALSRGNATRLTRDTGSNAERSACHTKASAARKSVASGTAGASRSSAAAMRVTRSTRDLSFGLAMALLSLAEFVPQASRSLQLQKGARSLYSAHREVQSRPLRPERKHIHVH